jgi:hypothetical protein
MKPAHLEQDKNRLERIWDEVQALNRAAGPWGIFGKGKGA